jgi:adenylate cyclase
VRVKGRREPVAIFELRGLGVASGVEAQAIEQFEAALKAWKTRDFEGARAAFKRVLVSWPTDTPARLYLEAIERLERAPPAADWDGVVTLSRK